MSNSCQMIENCYYLNWVNPKTSGLILASFNFAFLFLNFFSMNLVCLAAYFLLFYLTTAIVMSKIHGVNTEKDTQEYEYIKEERIKQALKVVFGFLVDLNLYVQKITSLEDKYLTLRYFIGLYMMTYLSSWFSFSFLLWVGVNILMIHRPLYKKYQNQIDNLVAKTKQGLCDGYHKLKNTIPRYQVKQD